LEWLATYARFPGSEKEWKTPFSTLWKVKRRRARFDRASGREGFRNLISSKKIPDTLSSVPSHQDFVMTTNTTTGEDKYPKDVAL